jgi:hypothetical protein
MYVSNTVPSNLTQRLLYASNISHYLLSFLLYIVHIHKAVDKIPAAQGGA